MRMLTPAGRRSHIADGFLALLLAMLGACGGGGETKTGSNGTGVSAPNPEILTAAGPITSLGPTGVGSITFDDAAASINIDSGFQLAPAELRLGMFAEAGGTIVATSSNGTASKVAVQSVVLGPVASVNPAAQQLTILSIPVQADQNTILDGITGVAAITPGMPLAVHALGQPGTNVLKATRLVALAALPAGPATAELVGPATGVTETAFNVAGVRVVSTGSSFVVGGSVVLPSPRPPVSTIAENTRVRVIGNYDPATNTIAATRVIGGLTPVRGDDSIIVLDGVVQSVSAPGRFRLNDTDVDASAAGGATIAAGARVQLSGRKIAGVLAATQVKVLGAADKLQFTVQGPISEFVSLAAFKVRGELIDASLATVSGGTAADLANGRRVLVRCQAGPGKLQATQVTLQP